MNRSAATIAPAVGLYILLLVHSRPEIIWSKFASGTHAMECPWDKLRCWKVINMVATSFS